MCVAQDDLQGRFDLAATIGVDLVGPADGVGDVLGTCEAGEAAQGMDLSGGIGEEAQE